MRKILSVIPDDPLKCIPSICLDFGWVAAIQGFFLPFEESRVDFRDLLDDLLYRGNDKLVIKVLWSITLAYPVENSTRKEKQRDTHKHCDNHKDSV